MKNRTYIFNTKSRGELGKLTDHAVLSLKRRLRQIRSTKPIIITVDGSSNAGKSFIWDQIVSRLLGTTAQKTDEYRPSSHVNQDGRSHETWEGKNQLEGKGKVCLKIFLCNADRLPGSAAELNNFLQNHLYPERNQTLPSWAMSQYGDIMIISNRNSPISDLHFDLREQPSKAREEWCRVVGIRAGDTIQRSTEFKQHIIRSALYSVGAKAKVPTAWLF